MGQHTRRSHTRTSKLGKYFSVDEHRVSRHQRTASAEHEHAHGAFAKYPEVERGRRWTPCFVTPNAKCPVCESPVYYYQNNHGSRVFFDDIGWPWPKHPCTDNGRAVVRLSPGDPEPRLHEALDEIKYWLILDRADPAAAFEAKYKVRPWSLARIALRLKRGGTEFLILDLLDSTKPKKIFIACHSLPRAYGMNACLSIKGKQISYFEKSAMAGKRIEVARYRSAAAFVDAMLAPETQSK